MTTSEAVVNGVKLHYQFSGDPAGEPVLLWHGFLGTSYTWRKVMAGLEQAGYAVLAPDMRGYGDSDRPAGTDGYDGRALAKEFRALVRQIGFGAGRALTIVAHDMGAPPALLWAAEYPQEVSRLFYLEEPVILQELLEKIIVYTPEAAGQGSLWWWLLPLAPGLVERLVVKKEREFLTWFYHAYAVRPDAIEPETVDEYLRTFSGEAGVLGAFGVYRAMFRTMEQTAPLAQQKVKVPVTALGGEKSLGKRVGEMLQQVAEKVDGRVIAGCGHFIPEEAPEELIRLLQEKTR